MWVPEIGTGWGWTIQSWLPRNLHCSVRRQASRQTVLCGKCLGGLGTSRRGLSSAPQCWTGLSGESGSHWGWFSPSVSSEASRNTLVVSAGSEWGKGGRSYWSLLGAGQGWCQAAFSAQDSPPTTKSGPRCQWCWGWETVVPSETERWMQFWGRQVVLRETVLLYPGERVILKEKAGYGGEWCRSRG